MAGRAPCSRSPALTREGCEHLVQSIYQHVASMQEHHTETDVRFDADGELIEHAEPVAQVDLSAQVGEAVPAAKPAASKRLLPRQQQRRQPRKWRQKATGANLSAPEAPAKKAAAKKAAAKKVVAKKVVARRPTQRSKDDAFVPDADDPRSVEPHSG